jgi:hypothetical protein
MAAVIGDSDIPELRRQLRALDRPDLIKRMTKEIRAEAKPALIAVRRAALASPSMGESRRRGRPSLRRELSRATVMKIKTNHAATVVIKTDPKKIRDPDMKGLPPYIEGSGGFRGTQVGVLRHPVFGNTDVWVRQDRMPYFYQTMSRYQYGVRAGIDRVADEIKRELGS